MHLQNCISCFTDIDFLFEVNISQLTVVIQKELEVSMGTSVIHDYVSKTIGIRHYNKDKNIFMVNSFYKNTTYLLGTVLEKVLGIQVQNVTELQKLDQE